MLHMLYRPCVRRLQKCVSYSRAPNRCTAEVKRGPGLGPPPPKAGEVCNGRSRGVGSRDFVLIDSAPGAQSIAAKTCKPTPPEVCQQSRGRAAGTGWGGSPTPTVHALEASTRHPHERHLVPKLSSSCSVHPGSIVNAHGTMVSRKLAACCMCANYDGFRWWMHGALAMLMPAHIALLFA